MPEPFILPHHNWPQTGGTNIISQWMCMQPTTTTSANVNQWLPASAQTCTFNSYFAASAQAQQVRQQLTHRQPLAVDAAAVQRARELLYEHLDEEQEASYRQDLYFETVGSNGTRYRIQWGHAGNVVALDDEGRPWRRYCCHPTGYPNEDTLLTQKLLLETDEDRFLAIANVDMTPADCEVVCLGAEA